MMNFTISYHKVLTFGLKPTTLKIMNSKTLSEIPLFSADLADALTSTSLKWHYENTMQNVKILQSKKKLESWETEDLEYNLTLAGALRIVCDYYGVETNETKEKSKKQKTSKVKASKKV
jgi:hypothetical protein